MRVVQLNLAADPAVSDAGELLDRYFTLTGWARAVAATGAAVHVIQRFSSDATLTRDAVSYAFVNEGPPGMPPPWSVFPQVVQAVARATPDVVHINGLMFPGMTRALRTALNAPAIALQDHSGVVPRTGVWPYHLIRRRRWGEAFRSADAVSFTARALAARWHAIGLPPSTPVLEIPEASTGFDPLDYAAARERTGVTGAPAVLWVGRLNANKDPLTMLDGFERVLATLPAARLWMIAPSGDPVGQVKHRVATSPQLDESTTLLGPIAREKMAAYFSAADVFVSASHHEGSGYALIEAMACGAIPCVTDIPPFRALTHGCAELWQPGDADTCATALVKAAGRISSEQRAHVRATFDRELSWDVIGRRTREAYEHLLIARREARA